MKSTHFLTAGIMLASFLCHATATDALSASNIASQLSALHENGSSDVRLRMEVQQPPGTKKAVFQIQIKERRAAEGADIAYVILWPKERKGEALLVHQPSGEAPAASLLAPGGKSLQSVPMEQSVFGSDLSAADTIENFFAWKNQSIVGNETVDRVNCQILESKPGAGDFSIYGRVRSWIDPKRMVPLRVEKYFPSGKLARRIDTTRVVPQGSHGNLPANLTISAPEKNSLTELDGSRIRRDVKFSNADFSIEGLRKAAGPAPAAH